MIRLSGSVKLRCAFGSGTACSGSGTCGSRPLTFLPVRASCSWRCLIWASAAAFFSSAFCLASASNSLSPLESSPAGSPAAPTPPVTRRPPDPSRTSRLRPHPPLRHAAAALLLPLAVSSPPRSSAHSSSPCACWHSPGSCCHRSPHVPASPVPPSHTTARLGKTAPPGPPDAVCETPPACYGRDVRRPPSSDTRYPRRSSLGSCASCSSPCSSRRTTPAPSSPDHRRLALVRPFPHRTHRWPQYPGHPPRPPESALNAFPVA